MTKYFLKNPGSLCPWYSSYHLKEASCIMLYFCNNNLNRKIEKMMLVGNEGIISFEISANFQHYKVIVFVCFACFVIAVVTCCVMMNFRNVEIPSNTTEVIRRLCNNGCQVEYSFFFVSRLWFETSYKQWYFGRIQYL